MTKLSLGLVCMSLAIGGCASQDGGDDIDQQLLNQYRTAIPTQAQLEAPSPRPSTMQALGDPAMYPTESWPIVEGINGAVTGTIALLELIVSFPPTVYNSDTREFVWGPFPEDVGYSAAYIRDMGTDGDFRYVYAFVRGASNDLATLVPVIWGGATPDPNNDDYGVGVTLWDFNAANDFAAANDPAYDAADYDTGRFVALWGAGPAEDDPANEMAFVVAVFRDFVSKDEPASDPVDLDYLYGRYQGNDTVDFIDFEANVDVSEPLDGVAEDLGIRMAFLNEGTGRAEADAVGDTLAADERWNVVECWDTSLGQTFIHGEQILAGQINGEWTDGVATDCGLFDAALDDLMIPSLQDIDPALLAAMDEVATNGVPAE